MKVDFASIAGPQFYKNENNTPQISSKKQAEFFHWMNESCGYLDIFKPLSDREIECLKLLLEGKPASRIAKEMSITARTAEHHIEHIKNKLMCSTKTDIFIFIAELKKLGGDLSLLQNPWN